MRSSHFNIRSLTSYEIVKLIINNSTGYETVGFYIDCLNAVKGDTEQKRLPELS